MIDAIPSKLGYCLLADGENRRMARSTVTPWGQASPATVAGVAVQLAMGEAA